ncbi:DUF294 nucleotidyltransferase-like domain-containing protein [Paenibacillus lemnae]|uniref:Signal transduction protein n=1 Tax=Paenibacillus lemnae TaxID=1330551 RepID=A0A848M526_PAELE|nr:DUF294 nucleotidyltransferase-like domain-containing protein [Paenibacillus lemnae]NMO95369.1 signal transduction protein [Paenibacillus lemnae]
MKPLKLDEPQLDFKHFSKCQSAQELREARIAGQNELLELQAEHDVEQWSGWVNRMHDEIGKRAVTICEQGMEEAGFGQPPARYAFVAFGSSGRQEATLYSDQDNGLIIGDELDDEGINYFETFGTRLSELLVTAGYPKCSGKVMCSEPMWNKKLSDWQAQLTGWSSTYSWEPTRYFIIASDMRHIAGSQELSDAWSEHLQRCVLHNNDLVPALLRNTVRHKATLNVMGRIVTERFGEHAGGFDVKYGVYIPLVNSIRTLALQRGIVETSTRRRMDQIILLEGGSLLLESVQDAFKVALRLRSETPMEMKDGFISSSGYMTREQLKDKKIHYDLRNTLGVVRRIHRSLQRELRSFERKGL